MNTSDVTLQAEACVTGLVTRILVRMNTSDVALQSKACVTGLVTRTSVRIMR
jgi:hypothetical protein